MGPVVTGRGELAHLNNSNDDKDSCGECTWKVLVSFFRWLFILILILAGMVCWYEFYQVVVRNSEGTSYILHTFFFLVVANLLSAAFFHGNSNLTYTKVFFVPLFFLISPVYIVCGKEVECPMVFFGLLLLIPGDVLGYFLCGPLYLFIVHFFCSACGLCIDHGDSCASSMIFKCIAAVFSPPLAVFFEKGLNKDFVISCLLTLGYFPGVYHATMIQDPDYKFLRVMLG